MFRCLEILLLLFHSLGHVKENPPVPGGQFLFLPYNQSSESTPLCFLDLSLGSYA